MFEDLIRRELPKIVAELYTIAQERQPRDCQGPLCSHRRAENAEPEWKHQLRRELSKLAKSDGKRNGTWRLKGAEPIGT